jgi:hypothetical protein
MKKICFGYRGEMMEIVKTKNIKGKNAVYSLTLMRFSNLLVNSRTSGVGYEVQFSEPKGDSILMNDGMYNKKEGLEAYDRMEKEVRADIKKGKW